jgi:ABC-type Zn uptake system ZnuABC Zn-binding protein ZnuA
MVAVMRVIAGVVSLTLLGIAGVGAGSATSANEEGRLQVATTVAPITSIVANIVGDRADVEGIVPEGTNSHTFEPQPSVAELLSTADVLYVNGLQLEEPIRELAAANMSDASEIVELGPLTVSEDDYIFDFSFPADGGKPNPHLWTNPPMALRYAEFVGDDMSERDPDNAEYYAANYEAFAALIDELDGAMRDAFATIPERKLLTYHDAYAYFAADYGWEVIGAIQVSDFEDPTPRDVAQLIEQVEAEGVPAIFGSEVFPSPVLEQIGREAGVEYVDVLRDDDLPGEPGDPEHSWLGLMLFDYITMTTALGGDASALQAIEVRNVAPDQATYPQ